MAGFSVLLRGKVQAHISLCFAYWILILTAVAWTVALFQFWMLSPQGTNWASTYTQPPPAHQGLPEKRFHWSNASVAWMNLTSCQDDVGLKNNSKGQLLWPFYHCFVQI